MNYFRCLEIEHDGRPKHMNREQSDIHSCSYYCNRPACVMRQRNELRDKQQAEPVAQDWDLLAETQAALKQAQTLIESLPLATVAPTPLFEPSGAIALEWDVGAGRFFVVALDGSGHIDYSAILGPSDEHSGRVPFKGRLPERAATLLAELLPMSDDSGGGK